MRIPHRRAQRPVSPMRTAGLAMVGALALTTALPAQTDFYNTDRGRPLLTEDALVIERRAFELQAAPLTRTRVARGATQWTIAPELAWGVLPRTQIEFALPVGIAERASARADVEVEGLEIEALHQLNAETIGWPVLAIGVGVHVPGATRDGASTTGMLRALATRTLRWGRVHLNAGQLLGAGDGGADAASRWTAGVAIDRTFVFRSLLVGAELVAADLPRMTGAGSAGRTEWSAGAGLRHQLSPRLAGDLGVRRRLSAGESAWTLTAGAAYAFARPSRRGVR